MFQGATGLIHMRLRNMDIPQVFWKGLSCKRVLLVKVAYCW